MAVVNMPQQPQSDLRMDTCWHQTSEGLDRFCVGLPEIEPVMANITLDKGFTYFVEHSTSPVPEPGATMLMLFGLLAVALFGANNRKGITK